mmetsp:Transcript_15428/g.65072  ORF Transcript_15428/g.65072 Transcript_15428/m.65072 type:complete len:288 (-) Transcript_15428:829-1692(-)
MRRRLIRRASPFVDERGDRVEKRLGRFFVRHVSDARHLHHFGAGNQLREPARVPHGDDHVVRPVHDQNARLRQTQSLDDVLGLVRLRGGRSRAENRAREADAPGRRREHHPDHPGVPPRHRAGPPVPVRPRRVHAHARASGRADRLAEPVAPERRRAHQLAHGEQNNRARGEGDDDAERARARAEKQRQRVLFFFFSGFRKISDGASGRGDHRGCHQDDIVDVPLGGGDGGGDASHAVPDDDATRARLLFFFRRFRRGGFVARHLMNHVVPRFFFFRAVLFVQGAFR